MFLILLGSFGHGWGRWKNIMRVSLHPCWSKQERRGASCQEHAHIPSTLLRVEKQPDLLTVVLGTTKGISDAEMLSLPSWAFTAAALTARTSPESIPLGVAVILCTGGMQEVGGGKEISALQPKIPFVFPFYYLALLFVPLKWHSRRVRVHEVCLWLCGSARHILGIPTQC